MTLGCMAEWQAVQGAERERVLWLFKKSVNIYYLKIFCLKTLCLSNCGFKSLYVTVLRKLPTLVFYLSYTLKSVSLPVQISSLSF